MKLKKKILIGIFAVSMVCIILQPNKANAALQSNGGTPATKDIDGWMLQVRKMQELGGTLGRTDTIDNTNLMSNATDLDIHMEKNTEYGAMAILSASAYGNPNKIEDGDTTTGNSTGIVIKFNKEWVAAGWVGTLGFNSINASSIDKIVSSGNRYKNIYYSPSNGNGKVEKSFVGDATDETKGWHGSNAYSWFTYHYSGMIRGYYNSIFAFNGSGHPNSSPDAYGYNPRASRAVIVVGTGI